MNPITLREIEFKAAELELKTEKLRAQQNARVQTTWGASALAREIRHTASRAEDWRIIETLARKVSGA